MRPCAAAAARHQAAAETSCTSARSRRGAAAAAEPGALALGAVPQPSGGGVQRRFRVRFVAEQVTAAEHMREVIGRVEALSATEITSIACAD